MLASVHSQQEEQDSMALLLQEGHSQGSSENGANNTQPQPSFRVQHPTAQFRFDDSETYCPLFLIFAVPDEYFDDFIECPEGVAWVEVTSNNGETVIEQMKTDDDDDGPSDMPFLNCTVEEIYEFYKAYLRPKDDSAAHELINAFTFIVVDEACFRADPKECILCSDAPDFGEEEVKLKQVRLPIRKVLESLVSVEMLSMTPSELVVRADMVVTMMPPAWTVPFGDELGLYKPATPAQARENKRRALEGIPGPLGRELET